jgi:hypothetical protein
MSWQQGLLSLTMAIGFVYGVYGFWRDNIFGKLQVLQFATTFVVQVLLVFCSLGNFSEPSVFTVYSVLLSAIYISMYASLSKVIWYRNLTRIALLFVPALLFYVSYNWPISDFPEEIVSVFILILTSLSIAYYVVMLKTPSEVPLTRNEKFWFNSAVVLYWPLTFVHTSLIDLIDGKPQFYWVPEFHYFSSVAYYSILVYCLHLSRKNRHEP